MKTVMAQYIKTALQIDDQEMIDELIGDYVNLFNETLPKIQEFFIAGDFQNIRHLAHMLKGVSANIGAERAREISLELQNAADVKNGELCASLIFELEKFQSCLDS